MSIVGTIVGAITFPIYSDSEFIDKYEWIGLRLVERDLLETVNFMIGMPLGAIYGFCGVWAIYIATRRGAWPALIWIIHGFREDKQKDGQKTKD